MKVSSLSLLGAATVASAACTREALTSALDAMWAGSPKTASDILITLNNKKVAALADTPYAKIKTTAWTDLKPTAVDTETCEIATLRNSPDVMISLRLKVDEKTGAINETEFVSADKAVDVWMPEGFPTTTPALYTTAQKAAPPPEIPAVWTEKFGMFNNAQSVDAAKCKATSGAARLWTRKELIYAASSYVDGLKGAPFDACIFDGGSCPRIENGVQTSENCAGDAGLFGFSSKNRRYVADTETGVVLGSFYFANEDPATLFVHEYFKVNEGKLAEALAVMTTIPQAQAAAAVY